MGDLTRITTVLRAGAVNMSHVTDLAVLNGQLYATTCHDGRLDSWTITDAGFALRDSEAHRGTLTPSDLGWISTVNLGAGPALLTGGAGAERLDGGAGSDTLDGGQGDDVMTGGAGTNTFVFATGADRINDFDSGLDHLSLESDL